MINNPISWKDYMKICLKELNEVTQHQTYKILRSQLSFRFPCSACRFEKVSTQQPLERIYVILPPDTKNTNSNVKTDNRYDGWPPIRKKSEAKNPRIDSVASTVIHTTGKKKTNKQTKSQTERKI